MAKVPKNLAASLAEALGGEFTQAEVVRMLKKGVLSAEDIKEALASFDSPSLSPVSDYAGKHLPIADDAREAARISRETDRAIKQSGAPDWLKKMRSWSATRGVVSGVGNPPGLADLERQAGFGPSRLLPKARASSLPQQPPTTPAISLIEGEAAAAKTSRVAPLLSMAKRTGGRLTRGAKGLGRTILAGGGWKTNLAAGAASVIAPYVGEMFRTHNRQAARDEEVLRLERMVMAADRATSAREMRRRELTARNMQMAAAVYPEMTASILAGRQLPEDAVALGGKKRTDLLEALAKQMSSGKTANMAVPAMLFDEMQQ